MRRLQTIWIVLILAALFASTAHAQTTISGSGGTVTTTAAGSSGISLSAPSAGALDVAVTTSANATSGFKIFNASSAELLRVQANGKVGIGTTTPAVLLDLKGNNTPGGGQIRLQASDYDQITFYDSNNPSLSSTNALASIYYDIAGTRLNIASRSGAGYLVLNGLNEGGGSVGIGAQSPSGLLQIGTNSPARFQETTASGIPNGVILDMAANSEIHIANLQIGTMATPVVQTMGGTGVSPLYLNRDTDNDVIVGKTGGVRGLRVQSGGTSTFAGNVTVAGLLTAGTVYANYQDVAEWVPTEESLSSGTVVVLSDEHANTVTSSKRAYDTGVAGVVSPSPGLLLGTAGASKAKIATTGRVRVRVDATNAPIRLGDLLVTSDRPGMAMRSEPLNLAGTKIHRPGTLIGKALEALPSGEGEILVLLSLQ